MNFLKEKIYRFLSSRKISRLIFIFYKIFGEKNHNSLGFDFTNKPSRLLVVSETIKRKNFSSYLEIGCFNNELFDYVKVSDKVGVDPIKGGTVKLTSDEFFTINKKKFDCIWIDGLHTYKQVKKDIINSLNSLNQGGIIFIHDCLPNNIEAQRRYRCTDNWNGDVWKALVEMRTNINLDIYTINADHGIGCILKRKNTNLLKINTTNFNKLKFKDFFYNHKSLMNIIEYNDFLKKF